MKFHLTFAAVMFLVLSLVYWGFNAFRIAFPCRVPVSWMTFDDMTRCAESRGFEVPAL